MQLTPTEENHLKAIFKLTREEEASAGTNDIAAELDTTAASVTDMLKRLAKKTLIDYKPRHGCRLSETGHQLAIHLVRKHRLWETFLADKLGFSWDEVHDIAEQLEHIHSPELVERLDAFLGHPRFDPHGDPIPDASGQIKRRPHVLLGQLKLGQQAKLIGVREHGTSFLRYLDRSGLKLGTAIQLQERMEYDQSLVLLLDQQQELTVSEKVGANLLVEIE